MEFGSLKSRQRSRIWFDGYVGVAFQLVSDFLIKVFNVLLNVQVAILISHIFFECPFAIQVWSMAGLWQEVKLTMVTLPSVIEAIFSLLQSLSVNHSQWLAALLWSIWKHQNDKV
jgi:hypothetical protein